MRRCNGFQLIELVVSLAVIGLLLSLAAAPLLRVSANTRVRAAAAELVGVMRTARVPDGSTNTQDQSPVASRRQPSRSNARQASLALASAGTKGSAGIAPE